MSTNDLNDRVPTNAGARRRTSGTLLNLGASIVLGAGVLFAALATYNSVADGDQRNFVTTLAQTAIASTIVAMLLFQQHPTRPMIAASAATVLIVVTAGIHFLRLAHPLVRGLAEVEVAWSAPTPPDSKQGISVIAAGGGMATMQDDVLSLTIPPGGAAGLQIEVPSPPTQWPWWAPRGAANAPRTQVVSWNAIAHRDGPYLIIFKSGRTSIQLTSAGIMITAPDGKGDIRETTLISPIVNDDHPHKWYMSSSPFECLLRIDDARVWHHPMNCQLSRKMSFGEALIDLDHWGMLSIYSVQLRIFIFYTML